MNPVKIFIYCLSVIFCAQTLSAAVDIHFGSDRGNLGLVTIDVSQHFMDVHASAYVHHVILRNDNANEQDKSDQADQPGVHDSCSGHVNLFEAAADLIYQGVYAPVSPCSDYSVPLFSLILPPDFKPPIYS